MQPLWISYCGDKTSSTQHDERQTGHTKNASGLVTIRNDAIHPDDLICTFTDDLVFDKFLLDPQLSQREREAAARLYKAVEEYADSTPQVLKPADVIDDPQFERVRIAAREFLKIAESVG